MNKFLTAGLLAVISFKTLLLAEETVPSRFPPGPEVPQVPEAFRYIPAEQGEFRLYLNSYEEKGAFLSISKNKLEAERQVDVPSKSFVPVLHPTKNEFTTWAGVCPFDITPSEIEMWLRLETDPGKRGSTEIVVTLSQDDIEINRTKFTLEEKDFRQAGDEGPIQVLVRSPVEGVNLKKGSNLSVAVTCSDGDHPISLWGLGFSHIEFRKSASEPNRYQMVLGVRRLPFTGKSKSDKKVASNVTRTNSDASKNKKEASSVESETSAWRTWSTANGKYKTEAKFVKSENGKVHLEKRDGKIIQVEIAVLSEVDKSYIRGAVKLRQP